MKKPLKLIEYNDYKESKIVNFLKYLICALLMLLGIVITAFIMLFLYYKNDTYNILLCIIVGSISILVLETIAIVLSNLILDK